MAKSDSTQVDPKVAGSIPRIKWDSTRMQSTYANVCNVASTREEVTLLFGTNQTWNRGEKEVTVELSDRIILNPYAAKRLSLLLQTVIAEYQERFGDIEVGSQPGDGAGKA